MQTRQPEPCWSIGVTSVYSARLSNLFSVLCVLLMVGGGLAQDAATNYEWELATPGRTTFRDRTPVGHIALVHTEGGGIFGKKGKPTGELLRMVVDVAFVPGDTLRFFAVSMEIIDGRRLLETIIVDHDELPSFWSGAKYISQTAANIANTKREDTQIQYRGKNGWSIEFTQHGQNQFLGVGWDDALTGVREYRSITPDQLSVLVDLIDLAVYELNRQGASIQLEPGR